MIKGYNTCRRGRNAFSTLILAVAPFVVSSCAELDLTPKLRDHYMGQEYLEDEIFNRKPRRDPQGNAIVTEKELTNEPEDNH